MRQAVILAGGRGTRLQERLAGRPKPLVDIDGVPLLGRQLALLEHCGITSVTILVNYEAEQIREYCAANAHFGMEIRLINEGSARGTAGAVLAALGTLDERFLVVYGDTLMNVNLELLWDAHSACGADATLFLHPNNHPYDSDIVEMDDDGWIRAFHSCPHPTDRYLPNLVSAALYVIERPALEPWQSFEVPSDFTKQLFPAMLTAGHRLRGYVSFEYIQDIGTPARLETAINHLRSGRVARASLAERQKAVFTDRDGTLNLKRDYVRTPEELTLIEGVPPAIRRLNDAEYRVVIVTNQSVLARGECTFEKLRQIHAKLETELAHDGAFVDRILFCPHHPDRGFPGEVAKLKIACTCRKPEISLIELATRDLNIDLRQSWFIGDSSADILAASRAQVRSILVSTGSAGQDGIFKVTPDFIVSDFPAAVQLILDTYPLLEQAAGHILNQINPGDVILIGGLAKLGKSSLAQFIGAALRARGISAKIISLDRWIRPLAERDDGILGRFDLSLAEKTLEPWFEDDRPIQLRLPIYDRYSRQRTAGHDDLELTPGTVLVIEGVPALAIHLPPSRRAHRIFVEGEEKARRHRVISDLILRGSAPIDAEAIYNARSLDETPTIENFFSSADWTICLDEIVRCNEHSNDH